MALEDNDIAARYLAAIIESSDDAIVSKDLNGIITSWNRAAERLFGFSSEEAVGRSIRMIIPADRQREEDLVLAKVRRGEQVSHFETVRVRKDGTEIEISLTVSPIRAASGAIVGASKIARDISERNRAARRLAQSEAERADLEQRLFALTAASGSLLGSPRLADVLPATLALASELIAADGYAVWQLDPVTSVWTIVSHSGISAEFAALAPTAQAATPPALARPVIAENVMTLDVGEDRRAAYQREGIQSMMAIPLPIGDRQMASLVFYYRQRHPFGEVEVRTAQALGNLGAAALHSATLYEEQRRSEAQARFLAEAGETLARSLDFRETLKAVARLAVPDIADWCAVDIVQPGGRLERIALAHADPAKVELAEEYRRRYPSDPTSPYSSEEVVRTGTPVLVSFLSDEMVQALALDAEHAAAMRALEIGSFICVPLRTRTGVIGTLTFVAAGSGRRYREADLRFAEAVAGRAALAIENALAYEEAHQANRLKDDFLATLSHELRTPLNAILGYTRMVRTGSVSPERRDHALDTVERNAQSLAQIVDDVLDISRVVAGKLALQVQPVRLSQLLEESMATVLPAAQAKGVALRVTVAEEVREIVADPDRLRQVFWNLLSNAVKFTSRGGRVSVEARRTSDEVSIVVSDTGEGIPREFLPFVFERFRQADSRIAGVRSGLGIGLAIARHIVEMHGGTIEAASEGPGRGATFRVTLPASSLVAEQQTPQLA